MNTTMSSNDATLEKIMPLEATSIGDLLKNARLCRGLTLKDVAKKTKVHVGILNQLENNNLTNLPSKTYVKGFVRASALFLDINLTMAMNLLEEAYDHLILENLDLIPLPLITRQESFVLKNLTLLVKQKEKPKSLIGKITMQQLSAFVLVLGVTSIGLINYLNNTINNKRNLVLNQTSLIEDKTIAIAPKVETVTQPGNTNTPDGIDINKAPITTSLVFPKYLETRNSEGLLVPNNRF
ncbi:MAG: helix-turn-helix domain-containing protein [Bacteriovorax sp.]|nr:helix-turn-helix domain-containing protein [Bacteriovorax sp.]